MKSLKSKMIEKATGIKDIAAFQAACSEVYTKLCGKCLVKVQNKPNMKYKDYCPKCQKMAEEKLARFTK